MTSFSTNPLVSLLPFANIYFWTLETHALTTTLKFDRGLVSSSYYTERTVIEASTTYAVCTIRCAELVDPQSSEFHACAYEPGSKSCAFGVVDPSANFDEADGVEVYVNSGKRSYVCSKVQKKAKNI